MQLVPTSLVRISRYYMLAAIAYLLLTLVAGVYRVVLVLPDERIHWIVAILGWMSFPIMGAYFQFFPTLQGRDLRHERWTLPQFGLVNAGIVAMIASAWARSESAFGLGLAVYGAGALLFVALILGNCDLGKMNLTLRFYLASLTFFTSVVILLLLRQFGWGPAWGVRPLLLHLFVFGWAVVAIMGAEYSMVPMLQLKELRYPRLASGQFFVAVAGVAVLALGLAIADSSVLALGGTILLVSIAVFAYNIVASLRAGPSRLKKMDISVRYFVVGLVYLFATVLSGLLMAVTGSEAIRAIHIHLGLIGLVTNTIVGATYHIVPFVVWWEVYAPRLGAEEVPLLKQLFDEGAAERQLYGLNAGLLLMVAGFALSAKPLLAAGGLLLTLVAIDYARQMLGVVGHRRNLRQPALATVKLAPSDHPNRP